MEVCNVKDLSTVREYFSHNIRTSAAMVVATVMVFKCGLSEDTDNMSDIISESAYFLDVYDKGMEIMFDFVLGKPIEKETDIIEPSKLINHFMAKVPLTIAEQGINFSIDTDDFKIKTNGHIVKNLIEMVLCEEARKSSGNISITCKEGVFLISKENKVDVPDIFELFVRLFAALNIEFSCSSNQIQMRFPQ